MGYEKAPIPGTEEFVASNPELVDQAVERVLENPEEFPAEIVEAAKGKKGWKKLPVIAGETTALVNLKEEIQEADSLYLEGKSYDLDRIDNEVSFYQDKAGESLLEIGKRLILVKLHEDHGKFLAFLEKHNMGARSAQFAMASAHKFSNTKSISYLGTTKMIALSILDEDDVQKLAEGGVVAGMKLDDIDRMTTRELRENLRKEKEKVKKEKEARKHDREIQEKAIAQKEAKINELDQQLRYQQPPTKEQLAIAELARLDDDYFHELTGAMAALRKAADILNRAQCVPGVNVQILNDWTAKYNDEMVLLNGVHEELTGMLDNLYPADKGGYVSEEGGEAQA
ncbi:MAG: hypothetical protein LBH57_04415 [Treponema sp.]|jgi:hypothetical protein|nr:hypothetical protein [Treponema sp.]